MRVPWLADVLRGAGLTVHEVDGWKGRGKDLGSVKGVIWHHTATGPRTSDAAVANLLRYGRSDLAGPLSQLGLDRKGGWWVVADGRANHNGYGTWGNDSIGVEAFNDGVGEPWPAAQVDSYVRGTQAILGRLGLDESHVLGHKESDPRRKIDPAGLDMNTMRSRIASGGVPPPHPSKELDDQEVDPMAATRLIKVKGKPGPAAIVSWDGSGKSVQNLDTTSAAQTLAVWSAAGLPTLEVDKAVYDDIVGGDVKVYV